MILWRCRYQNIIFTRATRKKFVHDHLRVPPPRCGRGSILLSTSITSGLGWYCRGIPLLAVSVLLSFGERGTWLVSSNSSFMMLRSVTIGFVFYDDFMIICCRAASRETWRNHLNSVIVVVVNKITVLTYCAPSLRTNLEGLL
jgi:hypothetical protein